MSNMKIISMNAASNEALRAEMRRNLLDVAAALRLQINDLIMITQRLGDDVDRLARDCEEKGERLSG